MKSSILARVTFFAIRSLLIPGTVICSSLANAAAKTPRAIDFKLSVQEAYDVSTKNFCRVTAGTETYNGILTVTHSEFVTLTCDGQTLSKGGEVSESGFEQRVDQILSQVTGELLGMGFKVVSCETNPRWYKASCVVAKQVLPKSELVK